MKFLVDSMAGRLARFLRLLGFDAEYHREKERKTIVERASREGRIILTRDKRIQRSFDRVIFLESDDYYEQAIQTIKALSLRDEIEPFSRCLECNQPLKTVRKEEARGKVPYYVWSTRDSFSRCPSCGRFYWKGTHLSQLQKKIELLFERLN